MIAANIVENAGTTAVKKLRQKKLSGGHPFMINANDLPDKQCYLEYPDGSMKLVTISDTVRDFVLIRELSQREISAIRRKFHLS